MSMQMMSVLGSAFLFADNLLTEEENKTLCSLCDEVRSDFKGSNPEGWDATNTTTFTGFDPFQDERFRFYNNKVQEAVNSYAAEHKRSEPMIYSNGWVNFNKTGEFVEEHIHSEARLSCIYYAKSPEGSSGTMFKSPYKDMFGFPDNRDVIGSDPLERRLIVFRSYIPHLVRAGKNKTERITLASNWA